MICSAVIALIHFSGSGLSAKTAGSGAKAGSGDYSYATAYESEGERGYRDIMPDKRIHSSYKNHDDEDSRAGSVSGNEEKPSGINGREKNCRKVTYTVKKGDTLYAISRKTGADVDAIIDLNSISGGKIRPGMKLKIESCSGIASAPVKQTGKAVKKDYDRRSSLSAGGSSFSWPLKKVTDYKRDGNDDIKPIGIFITGTPGSEVVASMDGVIKKIGYMRGYGKYVAISHEGRYVTVYSNLSNINVREGIRVSRGGVIGTLSSDRTLHFQIGHAGKPENPLKHLPAKG